MLGIAKGTLQVATTETHKDRRSPRVEALTLKGEENFVYTIHIRVRLDCFVATLLAMTTNRKPAGRRP